MKEFSPEDQKLILSCAAEAEKYGKALSRLSNDNGQAYEYLKSINKLPAVTNPKEELKKNGMTVTEYTPEMIKRSMKPQPVSVLTGLRRSDPMSLRPPKKI